LSVFCHSTGREIIMKHTIRVFSCVVAVLLLFACGEPGPVSPDSHQSERGDLSQSVVKKPKANVLGEAAGEGVIQDGEYAGQAFKVDVRGEYTGFGNGTLIVGRAVVTIGKERFVSIESPDLGTFASFCCGEGFVSDGGAFIEFSMYGQVSHVTADEPHNHLFAVDLQHTGSNREHRDPSRSTS
jgi:hypothetical protein